MHTHNEKSTRDSRAPLDAYDFPFFQGILTYLFLNIVLVAVVDYPEHTISQSHHLYSPIPLYILNTPSLTHTRILSSFFNDMSQTW